MYVIEFSENFAELSTTLCDSYGRRVGGRAWWEIDNLSYRVQAQTTRDGKLYGPCQAPLSALTLDEAKEVAHGKLVRMFQRYARLAARGPEFSDVGWPAGK